MASKMSSRLSGGKPAKVQDVDEHGRTVPGTTKVATGTDKKRISYSSAIGERVSDSGQTSITYDTLASADSAKAMPSNSNAPRPKPASPADSQTADLTPIPTPRAKAASKSGRKSDRIAEPDASPTTRAWPSNSHPQPISIPYDNEPVDQHAYPYYPHGSYSQYALPPYPPSYESHYMDSRYPQREPFSSSYGHALPLRTRSRRTSRPRPVSCHENYMDQPHARPFFYPDEPLVAAREYGQEEFFVMDRPASPSSSRRAIIPAMDGRPAMVHAHTDTRYARPSSYVEPSRSSSYRDDPLLYGQGLSCPSPGRRKSSRSTRYSVGDAGLLDAQYHGEGLMALPSSSSRRLASTRHAFVEEVPDPPKLSSHSRRHSVAYDPSTSSKSRRYSASPGYSTINESRSGRRTEYMSAVERAHPTRRDSKGKASGATSDLDSTILKTNDAEAYMHGSGAPKQDDLATSMRRTYSQRNKHEAIERAPPSVGSRQSGRSHRSRNSHNRMSQDGSSTGSSIFFRISHTSGEVMEYELPPGAKIELVTGELNAGVEARPSEREERRHHRARETERRTDKQGERARSAASSLKGLFSRRGSRDHTPSDGGSDSRQALRNARIASPILEDRRGESREERRRH